MLNVIWLGLIVAAVLIGGFQSTLPAVVNGAFEACKNAVMSIALPLAGVMALWLGLMRIAEKAGLVAALARWLRPVLVRLFPDVPPDHPAMGSMVLNMAANMLGLSNAATPLGLRAMQELERLNPRPGTATNAMCTFLAINTSSIQLVPATTIAILAAAGSKNPTAIIGTAFFATCCSTIAGLAAVKLFERLPCYALPPVAIPPSSPAAADTDRQGGDSARMRPLWLLALLGLVGCFAWFFLRLLQGEFASRGLLIGSVEAVSVLAIPFLVSFFPLYGAARGLRVYEEFVEGAKEGFDVSLRIIPYLVAIIVAVAMFRASGGMSMLTGFLAPLMQAIHFPPELLPLALMRPLSGSGANGIFAELVQAQGPDHILSRMGATIMGSTETTFYVIAVYFGSVAVRRTRHAVPAGLVADIAGIAASICICRWVFGS
jgi:spore maturation protein SpmA